MDTLLTARTSKHSRLPDRTASSCCHFPPILFIVYNHCMSHSSNRSRIDTISRLKTTWEQVRENQLWCTLSPILLVKPFSVPTMKTAVNVLERPGYDHWTPTYSMNTSTIKKHSVLQVEQMIQAKIAVQVPNIILGPLMTWLQCLLRLVYQGFLQKPQMSQP